MKKRLALVVVAVLSVALAAVVSSVDSTAATPKKPPFAKIKVQAIPIASIAPLYVGLDKHFFQQENLGVEIVINFQGGAANLAPVIAGDVQIGFSDVVPTMLALKSGVDLVSVAATAASERTRAKSYLAWTVKGDSPIRTARDFAGKTIASNTLNNVVHVTTLATLDKAGVDLSTVKYTVLPLPALIGAVSQGRVDSAQMVEPSLMLAKAEGQRPVLYPFVDALPNGGAISTYYSTGEWARKNPGIAARFRRAMNRSTIYASKHPKEVRAALPRYSGTSVELAQKSNMPSFNPKDLGPQGVTTLAQLMLKYGFWDSIPGNLKQLYPPPVK
jgi:NitT/TauT family transport system substrate-binding protein